MVFFSNIFPKSNPKNKDTKHSSGLIGYESFDTLLENSRSGKRTSRLQPTSKNPVKKEEVSPDNISVFAETSDYAPFRIGSGPKEESGITYFESYKEFPPESSSDSTDEEITAPSITLNDRNINHTKSLLKESKSILEYLKKEAEKEKEALFLLKNKLITSTWRLETGQGNHGLPEKIYFKTKYPILMTEETALNNYPELRHYAEICHQYNAIKEIRTILKKPGPLDNKAQSLNTILDKHKNDKYIPSHSHAQTLLKKIYKIVNLQQLLQEQLLQECESTLTDLLKEAEKEKASLIKNELIDTAWNLEIKPGNPLPEKICFKPKYMCISEKIALQNYPELKSFANICHQYNALKGIHSILMKPNALENEKNLLRDTIKEYKDKKNIKPNSRIQAFLKNIERAILRLFSKDKKINQHSIFSTKSLAESTLLNIEKICQKSSFSLGTNH